MDFCFRVSSLTASSDVGLFLFGKRPRFGAASEWDGSGITPPWKCLASILRAGMSVVANTTSYHCGCRSWLLGWNFLGSTSLPSQYVSSEFMLTVYDAATLFFYCCAYTTRPGSRQLTRSPPRPAHLPSFHCPLCGRPALHCSRCAWPSL